jgi:hypothetical protein
MFDLQEGKPCIHGSFSSLCFGLSTQAQGQQFPSLSEQLAFWRQQFWEMMFVWQLDLFYPQLDSHLWTIRIEFRASLALYVALVALSPARVQVRSFSLFLLSLLHVMGHVGRATLLLGRVSDSVRCLEVTPPAEMATAATTNTTRTATATTPTRR